MMTRLRWTLISSVADLWQMSLNWLSGFSSLLYTKTHVMLWKEKIFVQVNICNINVLYYECKSEVKYSFERAADYEQLTHTIQNDKGPLGNQWYIQVMVKTIILFLRISKLAQNELKFRLEVWVPLSNLLILYFVYQLQLTKLHFWKYFTQIG